MATVSKTIGSGGDFADIGLFFNWLYASYSFPAGSAMADDFEATILSDFTENTSEVMGIYRVWTK